MEIIKKYPSYKDSGVEWIGQIPEHWELIKLKRSLKIMNGKEIRNEIDINDSEVINVFGSGGVFKKTNQFLYNGQSVLFGRKGTIGKPLYVDGKFWTVDTMYYTKFHKGMQPKWFYYMFNVFPWDLYTTKTALPSIVGTDIENEFWAVPDLREQQEIVKLLDNKTTEIDLLISDNEKLITLLEEKRQAIITEAVTKGLNLDVKMKDSGVEWIGEIPEHWEKNKVKYSTYVKGRIGWQGLRSDEFIDEGPYLVTGTDFENGLINWETCYHIREERFNEAPAIQLKEDDLLITKDGTIGKIAIVRNKPEQAILNSGVFVTRCLNNQYLTEYMYWVLSSEVFNKYIKYMETGSTIKHLYQETFVNFIYPLPNITEQKEIVDYLNEETNDIDSIIFGTKKQIEKIKEYRQSLIYEAVTGKIDVQNYKGEEVLLHE
ncbi:restriction endonuclease subunit S [Oceanobacillus sp. 1P07AA]|uniref:restriction endonuclease subunit S n=1 Tax=Oceanobacillus sp. 1P07AA TaxID=3132293 RepID=UPI0039A5D9FE